MKKTKINLIILAVIAVVVGFSAYVYFYSDTPVPVASTPSQQAAKPASDIYDPLSILKISTVGQTTDPAIYLQSTEALERAYARGFKYFILNMSWTSDNQLVCMTDWKTASRLFKGYSKDSAMSYQEFTTLPLVNGEHLCTVESLAQWMHQRSDTTFVINILDNPIPAFTKLAEVIPDYNTRIIPPILSVNARDEAKRLGYAKTHWPFQGVTQGATSDLVLEVAGKIDVNILMLGVENLTNYENVVKEIGQKLDEKNILFIMKTIDDCDKMKEVASFGAKGIVTNSIAPVNCLGNL